MESSVGASMASSVASGEMGEFTISCLLKLITSN